MAGWRRETGTSFKALHVSGTCIQGTENGKRQESSFLVIQPGKLQRKGNSWFFLSIQVFFIGERQRDRQTNRHLKEKLRELSLPPSGIQDKAPTDWATQPGQEANFELSLKRKTGTYQVNGSWMEFPKEEIVSESKCLKILGDLKIICQKEWAVWREKWKTGKGHIIQVPIWKLTFTL